VNWPRTAGAVSDHESSAAGNLSREARGPVWSTILEIVDDRDPCVVVVGSRGLGGVKSALMGSVSAKLVHESTRPIVVVPSP